MDIENFVVMKNRVGEAFLSKPRLNKQVFILLMFLSNLVNRAVLASVVFADSTKQKKHLGNEAFRPRRLKRLNSTF